MSDRVCVCMSMCVFVMLCKEPQKDCYSTHDQDVREMGDKNAMLVLQSNLILPPFPYRQVFPKSQGAVCCFDVEGLCILELLDSLSNMPCSLKHEETREETRKDFRACIRAEST